jgi:hypothetical protein
MSWGSTNKWLEKDFSICTKSRNVILDIYVIFLLDFVEGAYSPGSIIIPKFIKQIIIRNYNILTIPIIVII